MVIKYRNIELDIKAGDAIAFRNNFIPLKPMSYISAAVRFFTKCKYNHTAAVIEENGELYLVEALGRGVVKRLLKDYIDRKKTEIAIIRDSRNFDLEEYYWRIKTSVGIRYDYPNLLLQQLIYRITGKKIWIGDTQMSTTGKLQCAELYFYAKNEKEWWKASTKEIYTHPNYVVLYDEWKEKYLVNQ